MASKFSSYVTSPNCAENFNDPLTHLPYLGFSRYFLLDIPTPYSTIQLSRSFIATPAHHCNDYITYPFMKPRRMAPVRSWRNQGGLV